MNLHHSNQCCVKIVSLSLLSVEDIDGMGAARNGEDRLWREEGKREREKEGERGTVAEMLMYRNDAQLL